MGFFKSLFGRDWRAFRSRGDDYFAKEEWGRARGEYTEALKRFEGATPEDDLAMLDMRDKISVVNYRLYETHAEQAKQFAEAGAVQRSVESWRNALEFATKDKHEEILEQITKVERAALRDSVARDEAERAALAPQAADIDPDEGEPAYNPDEEFVALLSGMAEERADIYEGLGARFRDGYLALMEGRLEDAEVLVTMLEEDPDNSWLQYEVGRLHIARGEFQQAREQLEAACAREPDVVIFRHALVEALWGLEDWDAAERVVEEAFEIDDELLENFRIAGETCLRSGEYDNGCEILEAGVETHEKSLGLHRLLGQLEAARDNIAAAIDAFEVVLRLRWNYDYETKTLQFDHESAFTAANLYIRQGTNLERAEELYRALLATGDTKNRWAYLVGIGKVNETNGLPDVARRFYVDAAAVVEDDSPEREQIDKLLADL